MPFAGQNASSYFWSQRHVMINTGILSAKKNFTGYFMLSCYTILSQAIRRLLSQFHIHGAKEVRLSHKFGWRCVKTCMACMRQWVILPLFVLFFFFCCTYRKSSRLIERQVLTAIKEFKDNTRSSNEQNTSQDAVNMVCTPTRLYARTYVNWSHAAGRSLIIGFDTRPHQKQWETSR